MPIVGTGVEEGWQTGDILPEEEAPTAEEQADEEDPVVTALKHSSMEELRIWLASPFWKAAMLLLDEQIKTNEIDLLVGGIASRAEDTRRSGETGPLYDSDESLRGGLIAMRNMQNFPELLRQAVEDAHLAVQQERGEGEDADY